MQSLSSSHKGFSLLELLTVVAIIGILASISVGMYSSFRQSSFQTSAEQDARNVGNACESYQVEHQRYPSFGPFTATTGHINFNIAPGYPIKLSPNVTIKGIIQPDASLIIRVDHPGSTEPIVYRLHIGN